jgi:hypothetical protein
MKEKEYYKTMCHMDKYKSFKTIHKKWHECFTYILKSRKKGYTKKIVDDLFYWWGMANWSAMHKENTEYKNSSKEELLDHFFGECFYICDRASYDRLFRTHWLFRHAFEDELYKFIYKMK